ncbi:Scr1 family TA system antitoxin-like transcriptional regulator [Micromonospora sp. NPDC050200]|uniref:Scr1 family TA system antitoxin-like transcriptional regulator n=1 Tax=Micromonospora sp. NPDC050200 TaxID=3155664 RepID=UPI0033DE1A11
MNRRYQRTATTITSGGKRNPANADLGGSHETGPVDAFTAQACLDPGNAQRNGAPDVMRGQLDRLQTVVGVPNIRFGILPLGVQLAITPQNSFQMYDDIAIV